jgi:hypothetical protein
MKLQNFEKIFHKLFARRSVGLNNLIGSIIDLQGQSGACSLDSGVPHIRILAYLQQQVGDEKVFQLWKSRKS